MKNILVTGGAGYIGSHVVKQLTREGFYPVVLDNLVYGHRESVRNVELVQGDLENVELVDSLFAQYSIHAVMHFAAYAYVGESVTNPAKYYQNNVASSLNLLRAMVRASVKNIIFSSTCATYGIPIEIPITENHPQNPINPYGATKWMVERMLQDFDSAYNLKSVIFRYFNAAGADPEGELGEWHEPETHLIPLVLDVAAGKKEHAQIYGDDYETPDGTCIRDFIHVADIAMSHIQGLKYLQEMNRSEIFNLGNGLGFSVRQVIQTAEKATGKKIKSMVTPRRLGDPPTLVGSAEKAHRILGWQPQFPSLDSIVETAWHWHQKAWPSNSAKVV